MTTSPVIRTQADGASPAVARFAKRFGGQVAHQVLGAALLAAVQAHFTQRNLEPNKMGATKQGFWEKASKGSSFAATPTEAVVTMPYPLKQKFYGGTINARPGKALAFPISPSVYGKTAREERLTGTTKLIRFGGAGGSKAIGMIVRTIDGKAVGEALFLLVKSVTQPKDERTLPPDDVLIAAGYAALEREAQSAITEGLA